MSKGLDALEKINNTICLNLNEKRLKFDLDKYEYCDCENLKEFVDCYCLIEKELKALEIIKEKVVDLQTLKRVHNVVVYNSYVVNSLGEKELTQEEYELLKEVLL